MIGIGQHSKKWYQRGPHRTVSLAALASLPSAPPAPASSTFVEAEQVGTESRAFIRQIAAVFPGTRVEISGIFRPIQVSA